jgi:hypothetical protein
VTACGRVFDEQLIKAMDDSPSFEQLALELVLSIALSTAVALAFIVWIEPFAYVALGFVVALILLRRRLVTRSDLPAWLPLAIVPIDTMLWPTAVVGDVLRARAAAFAAAEAGRSSPTTASSNETSTEDGPGSHTDQDH